jgi:nucleotide-binding universal stress UspA family protein
MENDQKHKGSTFLVPIDFSYSSKLALRKARDLKGQSDIRIVVLHVIDSDFIEKCIHDHLGNKGEIKRKLFLDAKSRLRHFLHGEKMDGKDVEVVTREGTPCIEINRKAVEIDADMIIIGSRGNSGDMKTIFFGSTAERVLRFIKKPVLCVPSEAD